MSRFTNEQMIEISRVRERLGEYKRKLQPYPLLEDSVEERITALEELIKSSPPTYQELKMANHKSDQALGIANYTKNIIQEHTQKKKRVKKFD